MAKFIVEWPTGKIEETEQSDCVTVEQFVNCRFGRGVDLKSFGVKVSLAGEDDAKEAPVKAPKTPKASKAKDA